MDFIQGIVKTVLSFSSDIVVLVALSAIFASIGLFFGKKRLVAIILAFYPAGLIFSVFPFFKNATGFLSETLVFLVFFLLSFYLFGFILSTEFSYLRIRRLFEATILGITATALTISFSYHVVVVTSLYNFSTSIDRLFLGQMYFWWLLIPLGVLFILRK